MYFKHNSMSPKKLENCGSGSVFYIMNFLFIGVILGYLIYDNVKYKNK